MRKFICISGKAQNGKDTTANILAEMLRQRGHKVLVAHQADLLKYICKTFFNWNGEKDEYGRSLLQRVGTDVVRKVQPDFWVDFMEQVTSFFPDEWDYIIVPDTRFPNEIEKLKTPTSRVAHIRVIRGNFQSPLTEEQQQHLSETALDGYPCSCRLFNNGTYSDLKLKVEMICDWIEDGSMFDRPTDGRHYVV